MLFSQELPSSSIVEGWLTGHIEDNFIVIRVVYFGWWKSINENGDVDFRYNYDEGVGEMQWNKLVWVKTTVEMIGISRALSPSQLFYTMSKMFTIGELKKKVKSAED